MADKITLYYRNEKSNELFKTEARETAHFYILGSGFRISKNTMESGPRYEQVKYFIETPEIVKQYRHSELVRRYRQRLECLLYVAKSSEVKLTPDHVISRILDMTDDWEKWL